MNSQRSSELRERRRRQLLAGRDVAPELSLMDKAPVLFDEEQKYRYRERLGMLCPEGTPTDLHRAMAQREAMDWKDAQEGRLF